MQQLLVVTLIAFVALSLCAGVIDDYQTVSITTATSGDTLTIDTKQDAGIIGGERILTAEYIAGALQITASVLQERFSLSSDVGTRGISTARYGAPGGGNFDPVQDFTQDGCDCWNSRLLSSDNSLVIQFEIESASGPNGLSEFAIPIDVMAPGIDVCLPYDFANFASYQDATSLEVRLIGMAQPNLDASISYICCQPRVDCWHELVLDDVLAGVPVSVKLTCVNYDSFPIRPESIDVSFGFDAAIATVSNAACDSGVVPSIVGNAMEYSSVLNPRAMVMCTFDLTGISAGTLMDIGAVIDIAPGMGTPARSHTGGPRSGTVSLCESATTAQLVIQQPPTTQPPTTQPPTTQPPTTQPPTTLAPRPPASVCVTPKFEMDGTCTCMVFPCTTGDDGDITCQASEWYCIYIRTFPDNGILNFSFRGVDCVCMI